MLLVIIGVINLSPVSQFEGRFFTTEPPEKPHGYRGVFATKTRRSDHQDEVVGTSKDYC